MKLRHTLLFCFSFFLLSASVALSQETQEVIENDSLQKPETKKVNPYPDYYGLRVGIDVSKILRSAIDDGYQGVEVVADFRIKKNYYLAAALGTENRTLESPSLTNFTEGNYIKAGFNYNAYDNWFGMNNLLYAGVYGGFSSFSQEIESFTIATDNTVFPNELITDPREFNGLTGAWLELQLGMEVEVFNNLYLGINLQLKRSLTVTEPDDFANLFIPGFGKVTEDSTIGVGYGYTISYLIPIFKK